MGLCSIKLQKQNRTYRQCATRAGMRGSAFDEYVANCFAVYRRTAAQTAR
jgi:hypothetical protein